jgi:hypothetical protein
VQPLELDRRYYGVYTVSTIEKHSTEAADLSDNNADDTYLIDSVLSIFDVINDDQDLVWYKPLEPDRIADALARVEWRQSIPEVGGQLTLESDPCSRTPQCQSSDCARVSERTSRDGRTGIRTAGNNESERRVDRLDRRIHYRVQTAPHAHDESASVRMATKHGATQVERKNDIQISLSEYDIAGDDPWADLSAVHEQLSIDFVHTYLNQAGARELAEQRDDGKQAFISRL